MLSKFLTLISIFTLIFNQISFAEEGMYPLNQLHKLDLKNLDFELSAEDIFDENSVTLSDAIVNVSGCTGSFVSQNGLILTNHHCAFRAIQNASIMENDLLKNGFAAKSMTEEIEAKGYTVRITESYTDVSEKVLSAVNDAMDMAERHKAIERKMKEIVTITETENPGKRAGVSEMFKGESYILFIYTYIKDVRLVYAPPRSVGEFGGDIDNWEWPRHNADFSFMRAYVAKDGSPADYSEDNIPYQPKSYLKINPKGVSEEDWVFILGYPGRTYRHRTSHFLSFEQDVRMPYVIDWYQWQIEQMLKAGESNNNIALKFSSRIKSLANTEKNYRGKLKGLRALELVNLRQIEEQKILNFINSDEDRKNKYDGVLDEIKKLYQQRRVTAERELLLSYLTRSVYMLSYAKTIYKAAEEREKDDLDRESAYMDRNFDRTKKRQLISLRNYDEKMDKTVLKAILKKAFQLPNDQRIVGLDNIFKPGSSESEINDIIDKAYRSSQLNEREYLENGFERSFEEIKDSLDDPFVQWYHILSDEYAQLKAVQEERSGALNILSAKWAEVKREYLKKDFIPDANSTFRLTFGRIRGYAPADAVYKHPITTLSGVVAKTTGTVPFDTPIKILELAANKEYGKYKQPDLNDVPVCILYNMDTTGGNSGSPVMNARGELIGLNFDRAFEATINDFGWSESYSRSIGVDVRYILWLLDKYAGANNLLDELGIK